MKFKFTTLSLSPLFILVIISNISGYMFKFNEFEFIDFLALIIMFIMTILIFYSIIIFISFSKHKGINQKLPKKVLTYECRNEDGLVFFMTYILPIVYSNFETIQNILVFIILLVLIFSLLCRTDLSISNPILILFGFNLYKVMFEDEEQDIMIIVTSKIDKGTALYSKGIYENYFYGRKVR